MRHHLVVVVATLLLLLATAERTHAQSIVNVWSESDACLGMCQGDNEIPTSPDGAGDKLVLIVSGEHTYNTNGATFGAASFAGAPMTEVIQEESTRPTIKMWFLDNPATNGRATFNVNWVNAANWVAYKLSGTANGGISKATSKQVSLSHGSASALVIVAIIDGGGSSPNTMNPASPMNGDVTGLATNNWHTLSAAHHLSTGGGGSTTYSFTSGGIVAHNNAVFSDTKLRVACTR
jgi:hypothetical protein